MEYQKELFPFESKWIEIEDHQVHYVDEGKGQPLLFCHPALGSSFMYREFIGRLRSSFRCIALDFPGFGRSPAKKGQEYSIKTQSRVLEQFLNKLALRNVIGLGHDTGGPSLFAAVCRQPDWFTGLILSDTLIFPPGEYKRISSMLRIVASPVFRELNASTNFLAKLTFSRGILTRKLPINEKAQYLRLFDTPGKRRRATRMLASLRNQEEFMRSFQPDIKRRLTEIPVLLLFGEKDPLTALGIPDRMQETFSRSTLHIIPGKGISPMWDNPNTCQALSWTGFPQFPQVPPSRRLQ